MCRSDRQSQSFFQWYKHKLARCKYFKIFTLIRKQANCTHKGLIYICSDTKDVDFRVSFGDWYGECINSHNNLKHSYCDKGHYYNVLHGQWDFFGGS